MIEQQVADVPGGDPGAPLLEVTGLKVHYTLEGRTVRAVDGVSFTVNRGEALGLVGESGCGKTTTALALLQLLPPNASVVGGSVRLLGTDLAAKTEQAMAPYRWKDISIVFQGAMNALNPVQRIGDQIAEPMLIHRSAGGDEAAKKAGDLLELVGIPRERVSSFPHELSGGMRQRVMIAMALACDPAVVIGDEPTTALDVMVQAQILDLIERLRRDLGLSMILITHDLSVIADTCDRVLIMYAGLGAESGAVRTVFNQPRHPYTQMLLRAFPNIHAERRTMDDIPGEPPDLREPPPGCRFQPRCPLALEICGSKRPEPVTFPDGVQVSCHLYPPSSDGTPVPVPASAQEGADL